VPRLAVSLQPASPISPPFSPPPQHLVNLQPTIILALMQTKQGLSRGNILGLENNVPFSLKNLSLEEQYSSFRLMKFVL